MALAPDPIKITGLKAFQGALKTMEDGLQKELRVALNTGAEIVADDARRRVPSVSGRARASVKAQSGQREAKIIGGSAKARYYGWLDFGGKVGPNKSTVRPFVQGGRYILPAFARNRAAVLGAIEEAIRDLAARNGIDLHG